MIITTLDKKEKNNRLFILYFLSLLLFFIIDLTGQVSSPEPSPNNQLDKTLVSLRMREYERRASLCERNIIHETVLNNDLETLQAILQEIPWYDQDESAGLKSLLQEYDPVNNTPLCYACSEHLDDELLIVLIEKIKKHEKKSKKDKSWLIRSIPVSLLHEAACRSNAGKIALLLHHYSDPNFVDIHNMSALYCAVAAGNLECIKILLDHPLINPNQLSGNNGLNALHWGLRILNNGIDNLKELTSKNITIEQDADQQEKIVTTEKPWCKDQNLHDCVLYIINHPKTDLFTQTSEKYSVLILASRIKSLSLVKAILDREKNGNWRSLLMQNNEPMYLFHFLIQYFDKDCFLFILDFMSYKDSDLLKKIVLKKNNLGQNALHLLARRLKAATHQQAIMQSKDNNEQKEIDALIECGGRLLQVVPEAEDALPEKKDPDRIHILRAIKTFVQKKRELNLKLKENLPPLKLSEWEEKSSKKNAKNKKPSKKLTIPLETSETKKEQTATKKSTQKKSNIVTGREEISQNKQETIDEDNATWTLVERLKKTTLEDPQEFPKKLFSEQESNNILALQVIPSNELLSKDKQLWLQNLDYQGLKKITNKRDWYHSFTQQVEKYWAPYAKAGFQERLTTREQEIFYTEYHHWYDACCWFTINGMINNKIGRFEYLVLLPSATQPPGQERPRALCIHRLFVKNITQISDQPSSSCEKSHA